MNNIFKVNQTVLYDLRKRNVLQSRNPSSVRYGTWTISNIVLKIWSRVPKIIKNCDSLKSFKQKIRKWKPDCPCRLCKVYLQHVFFSIFDHFRKILYPQIFKTTKSRK